jgi:hypothetical protein
MNRHVIFSLSFWFLFCFLCECYAVERSTQKTTGDQSPAAQADRGATIKIEYNNIVNQYISETKTKFSECLDIATVFQNQKLADLNKTIATLLVQNEGASKGEADKWAKDLIEQAPGFKKERENNNALIRKYNEELSSKGLQYLHLYI